MRALLALTLALELWAWLRVDGYQIADSVEFMERAQIFLRGEEMIDAGAIRPFGFSFALLPFFAFADWFGLQDLRALVWSVTLFVMLLGCVLVFLSARIGARIGGRSCAIATGLFVATNPVFLQYSTQPESGIPAGVCVALALERLLQRGTFRQALVGGLWLGVAFMVAYKTLLIALALLGCVVLVDRWRHTARWRGIVAGLGAALLLQSLLDGLMFGAYGASVGNYLAQNAGSVLTSIFLKVHHTFYQPPGAPLDASHGSWALSVADYFYGVRAQLTGHEWRGPTDISLRGKMGPWFYVTELPTMLVWPAIAALVLGSLRALGLRATGAWMLLAMFVINVAAMSNKGQKEFRLWIPLLPVLAPVCGLGWAWIADGLLARRARLRPALAVAAAAATLVLGLRELATINTRKFGGYWEAIDWVNARARETLGVRAADAARRGLAAPERLRVACAYHWAVYLRESPLVEMVKLPWQLNMWTQYEPTESGFVQEHADDLAELADLDVFLVHLPILSNHPELLRWAALHYDVAAAFYDHATYDDLGPIYVLERRTSDPRGRRFLDVRRDVDAREFQDQRQMRGAMDFFDPTDPSGDRLELLGVEYRDVPPHGYGWITYHWRAPRRPARDWTLVDRITAPAERYVWDNGHRAAYGALPTDEWEPGAIVSEGYLVVPIAEPYRTSASFRPIGDGYRRGDLIPVRVWMGARVYGASTGEGLPPVEHELAAARPGSSAALRGPGQAEVFDLPDGAQFSADGLVRVHGFLLPVLPEARLPDDGRPVPE